MSRQFVRHLKRTLRSAEMGGEVQLLARESATALLERSILFGHGRLAVVRLSVAAQVGAVIPPEHWAYCEDAARRSGDAKLQALLSQARHVLPCTDTSTR